MLGSINGVSKPSSCVAALQATRHVWQLQTRQLSANVGLIKALGGGWNVAPLAASNPIH
ncbi:hypothetical protein [Pseudomonas antarctica]|uniref:hypothetical protein n=1 Tax=Pseudomonas antarctica TaxID=219572 RepID=UPI00387B50E6